MGKNKGEDIVRLRKSFIIRLFVILLTLFLFLLSVTGLGIYFYTRRTVGEEFRRLNQAYLIQIAKNAGRNLADVLEFGEKVSGNSRLLGCVDSDSEDAAKEVHAIVESLLTAFGGRSRLEVYVLGKNGLVSSSYNTNQFSWEELLEDPRLLPLLEKEADMLLLPTEKIDDRKDIMTYSFQVVYPLRDLLTGEELGLVVLEVSELFLCEQYRDFIKGDTELCIITPEGEIISHSKKTRIGSNFGADLETLSQQQSKDGYLLLYERIPASSWILVEQIPEKTVFGTLNRLRNVIALMVLTAAMLFAGATVLVSRRLLSRVMEIRNNMEKVMVNDLTVRTTVWREDELGSIERAFNAMVAEIDRLIRQTRQSEHQKRVAEMDFLHAQINSHFIHNTLTSIRFLLEMEETERAGEMIFYFSKLLRQTLSRSDEFIPLKDEIDTLQSYMALQRYRYPDTFEVFYDIAPETEPVMVPTLILQPVAENAIFHAVGHGFTHIYISARRLDADLELTIRDDGVGMTETVRGSVLKKGGALNRVGLRNVHERIQLNYGKSYGLRIDSELGVGTTITFLLPYNVSEEGEV